VVIRQLILLRILIFITQLREHEELISIASGEGLTYNSSTGVLGTSAIPNAQLANSSVTIGSTAVALGATVTTFTGIADINSNDW
jgi:hypothetical protein